MLKESLLKPSQRNELLRSIEEKHEIPHKFAYLNTGARAWDKVSKDISYDLGERELLTLRKFMQLVSKNLTNGPFNIIHVGPGNGIEIPIIVSTLGIRRISNYALIDISPECVKTAEGYGKENFNVLRFLSFIDDITTPGISKIAKIIRKSGARRNLILLIANGAILSNSACLTYIRKSMMPQDRLVITLELYSGDRENQILEQYKLPSIINLFTQTLSLIGIHDPAPKQFEFVYDKKRSMIEVYFHAKEWLKLHAAENITFDVSLPDRIKVFSSLRPTPLDFRKFLAAEGFKIQLFHFFKKERCCGVVLRLK